MNSANNTSTGSVPMFSPAIAEAMAKVPGCGRDRLTITALLPNTGTLINRDLAGMAKQLPFGDAIRERSSSQWFKARTRDLAYNGVSLATIAAVHGLGRSVRSRHIFPVLVFDRLSKTIGDEAGAWCQALSDLFLAEKADAKQAEGGEAKSDEVKSEESKSENASKNGRKGGKSRSEAKRDQGIEEHGSGFLSQPIVLGEREITVLSEIAETLHENGVKPEEIRTIIVDASKVSADKINEDNNAFVKKYGERLRDATKTVLSALVSLRTIGAWSGIDSVLYGRFATSDLVTRLDPAVHVAHGVGTTPMAKAIDFFSVVDQIHDEGTAHIGNTEVTSNLRHQHLVIDPDQMWFNLGPSASREAVADLTCWVIGVTASGVPGAKPGGTAPYQAAEGLVVEIGKHMPRSHVGAFVQALQPKRGENLYQIARERLAAYMAEKDAEHGAPERRFVTTGLPVSGAETGSVAEICAAVRDWIVTEWMPPQDIKAGTEPMVESAV